MSPLTALQKSKLCILAKAAWLKARRAGLDDSVSASDYRAAGQLAACGCESLRDCTQAHYLALRGHWFVELGELGEAFTDFLNAGEPAERLRQLKWRFAGQLASLAEAIAHVETAAGRPALTDAQAASRAWAYASKMAADKHFTISAATAPQIEQLGFQLTNRANALLGKGSPATRNKSQRTRPRVNSPESASSSRLPASNTGSTPLQSPSSPASPGHRLPPISG